MQCSRVNDCPWRSDLMHKMAAAKHELPGSYLECWCPVIDTLELKARSTATSGKRADAFARWDSNSSVVGVGTLVT